MKKITTMRELLNERLSEEEIIKLVSNYDNKFSELENENKEQKQEIKRLNNIINELEGELERESNMKEEDTCLEHNTFIDIKNTLKTVLKRLQELKRSDK